MTDMRNVNNWHWVNKDCRPWAKTYLTQQLVGLSAEKNKVQVHITSLDECIGDVDLNQRKGKLLVIYDVTLKLSWQGQLPNGTNVFGNIMVPEMAYDTELEDYVFVINVNNNNDQGDQVKKLIRTELTPLLRNKFANFTRDLIGNYSSDLYADKSSLPPTPDLVQRKKPTTTTFSQPPQKEQQKEDKVVKTTVVEHSYEFRGASARDIYEALLDSNRAAVWTHGKSKVSKRVGSEFEFFDGNVHGVLLQATPGKSIMQTWRLKNWPKYHFSTVTLNFVEKEDGVTVNVNQVGVPVGQEEIIRKNWMGYYWNAIKDSNNHGQFQNIPITSDLVLGLFETHHLIIAGVIVAILIISFTAYSVAPTLRF